MLFTVISSFLFFLPLFSKINCKGQDDFNTLLQWATDYSLELSDKIGMKYVSENNRTFYVKSDLQEEEVILRIPSEILLSVDSAFEYYGKKTKKLYEKFIEQKSEHNDNFKKIRMQQAFLGYLMYMANEHKDAKKNKEFYHFYRHYFKTFETNLDSFPAFFNLEQLVLLEKTACGNYMLQANSIYKEEFDNLQKLVKNKLEYDTYIKYRTYSVMKGKTEGEKHIIIPFLDMFNTHPVKFNLNYTVEEWGVKVFTTRKIKARKKLYLRGFNISNCNSMIMYGKTFDDLVNLVESFDTAMFSPLFTKEKGLDEKKYPALEKLNIAPKKFYKTALPKYKKVSKELEMDGSDLSAYRLLLRNLELLESNYENITTSEIHKKFFSSKDIESIKRIIDTEVRYFDAKIDVLRKVISATEKGEPIDDGEDDDYEEPAPDVDDTKFDL